MITQTGERIDIEVGQVLRAGRKQADLSVADLAKQANLSADTILAIEVGAERASAFQLFQFSCILGIELRSFFDASCNMQMPDPLAIIHQLRRNPAVAALVEDLRAEAQGQRAA